MVTHRPELGGYNRELAALRGVLCMEFGQLEPNLDGCNKEVAAYV